MNTKSEIQNAVFYGVLLIVPMYFIYSIHPLAITEFDVGIFCKIVIMASVFFLWSFAMFYKNQLKNFCMGNFREKFYFFYIKSPFYIFAFFVNNALLIYVIRHFEWTSGVPGIIFIFIYNLIVLSLLFNFFLFAQNRPYVTVNLVFWIIIGISMVAFHLDLILGLREITVFNPLSGWFFIMIEDKGFNYFTSLNLLFLSAYLNFFYMNKLKTYSS